MNKKRLLGGSVFGVLLAAFLAGCATSTQPSAQIPGTDAGSPPIFNFQVIDSKGVYRSGQPKSDADWAFLGRIGVTKVIKLNQYSSEVDEAKEFDWAQKYNIKVIPVYMAPEDFPHNLNPWARPDLAKVKEALAQLENGNNEKILVHCSHGKDRTGLIAALYDVRHKNLCKSAAYEQMKFFGTNPMLFGLKPVLDDPSFKETANCVSSYK